MKQKIEIKDKKRNVGGWYNIYAKLKNIKGDDYK